MLKFATAAVLAIGVAIAVPAQADEIMVTQYHNDPSGAPFAIGMAKGMFKKHGIELTGIINGQGGGASLRAALATTLGFGEVSAGSPIVAIDQGQDLKIVGIGSRFVDFNIVVMPNSKIKTLKDLNGKKFGISNPMSLTDLTAVLIAEKAGLKPDAMKRVALGSLGGALTAMEKGVIDVTGVPAVLYRMKHGAEKYRSLLGPKDMPRMPPAVEVATTELMKNHPDKLRAILAGRAEAVRFIYEHPDEAATILAKTYAPLPPDQVKGMVHELVDAKFWSEGNFEMSLLETAERAMLGVGMLKHKVDLKKEIDPSFLPKDLQKVTQ